MSTASETPPPPSPSEALVAAPQGQAGPSLAELLQFLPEAGHVYVTVALERWNRAAAAQQHAEQLAGLQRQADMLRAALLGAGIDPLTLQPKGTPEVGAPGASGADD